MVSKERPDNSAQAEAAGAASAATAILESAKLFGNSREIVIAHGEDSYRLRITSKGKLILTK